MQDYESIALAYGYGMHKAGRPVDMSMKQDRRTLDLLHGIHNPLCLADKLLIYMNIFLVTSVCGMIVALRPEQLRKYFRGPAYPAQPLDAAGVSLSRIYQIFKLNCNIVQSRRYGETV